jgi:hypothetical protein
MKQVVLFVLLLTAFLPAQAQVSAVRRPDQNYLDVAQSHLHARSLAKGLLQERSSFDARSLTPDLSLVAEWKNGDINKAFKAIRDERFMVGEENFSRRPTWLYPYDGCYARAELAAQRLMGKGFATPSKIFIFGNLMVKSANASDIVTWWYHVAAAYRYKNEVYIFDPAIEPKRLLTLEEWKATMGPTEKEISICSKGAYDPDSNCDEPVGWSLEVVQRQQAAFFNPERENLVGLGRDPIKELGDNPPWKD